MSISVTPSLLTIGLLGLLIVKYTPLFDWIGYLFLPAVYLTFLPEPLITSKAVATGFAEMFLPALTTTDAMDKTRYVVGVTSIASILFLSASIPCIMATSIKIPLRYLAIIWFQRAFLSILFAAPVAHVIF